MTHIYNPSTPGEAPPGSISWAEIVATDFPQEVRIPGVWAVGGDADGGDWAGCDQAADLTVTELFGDFAVVETAGGTDILSSSSHTDWPADYMLMYELATNDDALYIGSSVPFHEFKIGSVDAAATYTGDAVVPEYWNGSAWTDLTMLDGTDTTAGDGKRPFAQAGTVRISPADVADWASTTVNAKVGYWIRYIITDATKVTRGCVEDSGGRGKAPQIILPTTPSIIPFATTLETITIRNANTTPHTANDIEFCLVNLTTGLATSQLVFQQDRRQETFTGESLVCSAGDELWVYMVVEDGTDEATNAVLEVIGAISD